MRLWSPMVLTEGLVSYATASLFVCLFVRVWWRKGNWGSVYSWHLWGWGFSPPKFTVFPLPNCALNLFSTGAVNYKCNHGNILFNGKISTGNYLLISSRSQGCEFMPKMHQNTFGGRAPLPGPTGRAHALHRPSICNGGLFNGREGREGAYF